MPILLVGLTISGYCTLIQNRILNNFDCINLVTGPEGSGKSAFADWCAHRIDKRFRLETHTVFYDIDHFWKLWRSDAPGMNIILDEAVAQLFNRTHGSGEQIRLVEEIIEGRFRRKVIWMCIPRKDVVDPYIRKFRAKYWIWVPERRGLVTIREAQWKEFENPNIKDGTWWEMLLKSNFPPTPKDFETMYSELRVNAKKEYEKKIMLDGSEARKCDRCGSDIFFKQIGKNWVPFELDGRPHIPLCTKNRRAI